MIDSLLDSLKIFGFAFLAYFLLSFFEGKVAGLLGKKNRLAPLAGAAAGVIPQCGISVVGADLYLKRHLTAGTLLAMFIACSDEALPVLFSDNSRWYMGFALLAVKMVGGFMFGFLLDAVLSKARKEVEEHHEHCEGEDESSLKGCCGHEIEEEDPIHMHLVHPLVHSLKIFLYSFVVIFLFGTLMFYFEEQITSFLASSSYFSPLVAVVIGLIPNCASSVLVSTLYIEGAIPFAALVSGLSVNAGLGTMVLLKDKSNIKRSLLLLGTLIVCSLILGYAFIWVA